MAEFERDNIINVGKLHKWMLAEKVAVDMLTDNEREKWFRWENLRKEFNDKFGLPHTDEMSDKLLEMRRKLDPEGYKVFGKVARLQDQILESGKG